jgi:hypothetical protein
MKTRSNNEAVRRSRRLLQYWQSVDKFPAIFRDIFVIFLWSFKIRLFIPRFLVEPTMIFCRTLLGSAGLSLNRWQTDFITYDVTATFQNLRVKLSKIWRLLGLFTSKHGVTWKKTWIFIYDVSGVLVVISRSSYNPLGSKKWAYVPSVWR